MKNRSGNSVRQISFKGLLMFALLFPAGLAFSQKSDTIRNKFSRFHHERMSHDHGIPNLTKDQRQKMEALQTPLSKEMLPLMNQLGEKRAHLRTLQTADKADLTAINATIDEIGLLQSQMMKKRAANTQAIRKLLTDEQRIAFDMKSGKGWDHKGMKGRRRN